MGTIALSARMAVCRDRNPLLQVSSPHKVRLQPISFWLLHSESLLGWACSSWDTSSPCKRFFFAHSAPASARKINIAMSDSEAEGELKKGKVKWFDVEKGIGFIEVEGDQDYFVHQTAIYAPGFRSLDEGEDVEFKVGVDDRTGKTKALEVTGPGGNYVQGVPRPDANDGGWGGSEEGGGYDSHDE